LGWIVSNGLRVWYERSGRGPPVLCLTGTGGDLRRKPSILDSPLTVFFELIAFDQRGLGRTDKPYGPYTMAQYAEDALGMLDALDCPSAHVFGISFGGMVAQEVAIRFPDRVQRLVLCSTTAGGAGGRSYPQHLYHHLSPEEKVRHMLPIADVRRDAEWQASHTDEVDRLVKAALDDPYAQDARALEGRRLQIDARGTHDTWDRLDEIRAPTLICTGRFDGQAAPTAQERMASRIANSTIRYFEGGHMLLGQDPSAWSVIRDFLKGS
jgi:3-oxoadipate enol-lactonase